MKYSLMNKNNILLLSLAIIISGCASYNPQYKEEEKVFINFPQDSVERSFYLIGDVGYSPLGGKSDGLLSLESLLQTSGNTQQDYLIFLGDNIYPTGMPVKNSEFRPIAENHLNAQIDVAKQFNGQTIFIPGNHDYYNENLANVKREKKYIEDAMNDKDIWKPTVGCPIESKAISVDIQLLIIDSQWFLEKWDNIPEINQNCEQIKTRDDFFYEIENEFKKHQDKTILVIMHHPIFTNGTHGGQYAAIKHLYPSQSSIPVPILGSLASLIRTSGGVSAQDKQNKRYQYLADRIATLANASKAQRIVFASGHEHTLQYIVNDGVRQIVSGSGSKQSYASLSNDGLFSYGGNGFARMDVMKNGSSWVQFYGLEDGKHKLLFTKKVIEEIKKYNVDSLPESFSAFAKANIYKNERTDKSEAFKGLWGEKYRNLYGIEVTAKVALLDTLKGGLEVMRADGGYQMKSLRLKDKQGREYGLRALKKNAAQLLQTTIFKERPLREIFKSNLAEDLLYDFYTAAHPYGSLVIPSLSKTLDIYHTNPELFYVPKQKALGNYNFDYGDELYVLEERPDKILKDASNRGQPIDIESTADVFERLARDEKFKVDQDSYIRARMFDMLVGDWDRSQDQWRWAEFEDAHGNHVFKPIPTGRDQVFSNFDGAVFATLRTIVGITKQFATYNDNVDNVKWFNTAAVYLDRSLASEAGEQAWLDQAKYIQENLTDAEIEAAFQNLPAEVYLDETTGLIIESMKKRRSNLVDIAERYYNVLSRLAVVKGTNKDDIIEVDRFAKEKTRVSVYRNKNGQKADLVFNRVFDRADTKEIWIYALDDNDIIYATGKAGNPIKVRIIGGHGNDVYDLEDGRAITLHDHETKENTFLNVDRAVKRTTDAYDVNLYDPKKDISITNVLTPAIGFNPDDGVRVGLQNVYTVNGFHRNPHTRVHKLTAGYFFATQGYTLGYDGEFAGVFRNSNLIVNGRLNGPTFTENFFGFGNETLNNDDDLGFDFNRVRISTYEAGAGSIYRGEYGSNLRWTGTVRGIGVEKDLGRFITEYASTVNDPEFFDRKWYGDINAVYSYSSYDNQLNPTRGMMFEFDNGITGNLNDLNEIFYYFKPKLGFHNAIIRNRKFVLRTLAQAHVIVGDDFEFYQSAQLGQNTGLRGYRTQRFSGESSFAGTADLRYSFKEFTSGFLPLQIGIFGGADVGRVWLDGEGSKIWHNNYGGGFWINSAEAIGATFNLFHGEDGLRFSFQLGFNF